MIIWWTQTDVNLKESNQDYGLKRRNSITGAIVLRWYLFFSQILWGLTRWHFSIFQLFMNDFNDHRYRKIRSHGHIMTLTPSASFNILNTPLLFLINVDALHYVLFADSYIPLWTNYTRPIPASLSLHVCHTHQQVYGEILLRLTYEILLHLTSMFFHCFMMAVIFAVTSHTRVLNINTVLAVPRSIVTPHPDALYLQIS